MKIYLPLLFVLISFPAYALPELKVEPAEIIQGKQFMVEITDNTDNLPENMFIEVNGKKLTMFPLKESKSSKSIAFVTFRGDQKPGDYKINIISENNEIILESKVKIKAGKFGSQNISFYRPKLTKEQEEQIKKEDALVEQAKQIITKEKLWNSSFMLPVNNSVSAIYGIKRYLNGKYNDYHSGVDFASPYGVPIKAINNGKVILARYFSRYNTNGNLVFLDHGFGVTSVYLHQSKIAVKEGDFVKKGQIIGYVGSTGRSTGPHLHWGLYLNGQNTDGLSWVKFSRTVKY